MISKGFPQDEIPPELKVVEQDSDGIVQPEVKSYYQEDPHPCFHELVSQLGVRTPAQRSLKSTPPSVAKKTKRDEDLVVCSNGNMYDYLFYKESLAHSYNIKICRNKEEGLITNDKQISTGNGSCQV